VVPTDREVYLRLQSADVIHSLFIPDWGIKQDVFPGQTTLVHTRVYQPGVYRLYCAELCGVGHSRMTGNATAVSEQKYRSWLDAHRNETGVTTAPQPRTGQTPEDPVPEPPTNVSNVTNVTNVTNATS
jgi:cytochrome c oxidase subunit 2